MWSEPHFYKRAVILFDIIIAHITDIINISMETSTFPPNFKEARARPVLGKNGWNENEKLQPCIQVQFHLRNLRKGSSQSAASSYKNNQLSNPLQSASRKQHYTESVLLKVHNDIIISMDNCLPRVVTKAVRFSPSVPILKQLLWLPVKFRIYFKICTMTFWTIKSNLTAYFADFIFFVQKAQKIYATQIQIIHSPHKNKPGSGFIAGPALWNDLLVPIRMPKQFYIPKITQISPIWSVFLHCSSALAWIMTHDHTNEVFLTSLIILRICAPLSSVCWGFRRYWSFIDWLFDRLID